MLLSRVCQYVHELLKKASAQLTQYIDSKNGHAVAIMKNLSQTPDSITLLLNMEQTTLVQKIGFIQNERYV